MIADPYVAAAGATCSDVAALMRAKDISVVPVVDNPKDRRFLGTISDRDIVTRCVGAGHDPTKCPAEQHLRAETPTVRPEAELTGYRLPASADPADSHVRVTIVVVNGDRRVVGFIPHPEQVEGVRSVP